MTAAKAKPFISGWCNETKPECNATACDHHSPSYAKPCVCGCHTKSGQGDAIASDASRADERGSSERGGPQTPLGAARPYAGPGLYSDVPEASYHSGAFGPAEGSLSASGAKVLLGKRAPSGESDALIFGRLVHTVILEPHKLDTYAALDASELGLTVKGEKSENPRATKAWKEAVFAAERDGLTVIEPSMLNHARAVAAAVEKHPEAARLLAAATGHEVSAYAEHPSGAMVRARFDLNCPGAIVDVKTCRDGDPETFGRTMHALMYHVSAANYLDIARANGLKVDRFDLICVEKEPTPGGEFRVSVLEIHPDAIDKGRELMALACDRWLALGKRIDLPSYGTDRHVIDLPGYAYDDDFDIQIDEAS